MANVDANRHAIHCPSRRVFLASAGALVAWANLPRLASAAERDPRLVVVILRGALDGLAAVPPIGDPGYAALRGDLAIGADGRSGVLPLDGFFGLNDAMPAFHKLYTGRSALIVHAAASPYRERSHFDGQEVLESGVARPGAIETGWLNRAVAALPTGDRAHPVSGLAVSSTVPLIMRGEAPTLTWTPENFRPESSDTAERLLALYTQRDPELAKVFEAGTQVNAMTGVEREQKRGGGLTGLFRTVAVGSARLLAKDGGPRVAVLSYNGWDTHFSEGADQGRLANQLAALDAALDGMAIELGPVWADTVVAVVTEFGRTARENGSEGTDHGTATTAFLLGGAVKGGRVIADWPGLKPAQLHENRDLAPTTDLRALLKGVLHDHLGLSENVLGTAVFPGSEVVRPLDGLLA